MNIRDYCKKCSNLTKPASKDPCKSCMDFGIRALGRPVNFREGGDREAGKEDEKKREHCSLAEENKNLKTELNQAITVIKDYATRHGECIGCLYDYKGTCTNPEYKGICDNEKENHFEWRGLIREEKK